jgi:hypothetical protein
LKNYEKLGFKLEKCGKNVNLSQFLKGIGRGENLFQGTAFWHSQEAFFDADIEDLKKEV